MMDCLRVRFHISPAIRRGADTNNWCHFCWTSAKCWQSQKCWWFVLGFAYWTTGRCHHNSELEMSHLVRTWWILGQCRSSRASGWASSTGLANNQRLILCPEGLRIPGERCLNPYSCTNPPLVPWGKTYTLLPLNSISSDDKFLAHMAGAEML